MIQRSRVRYGLALTTYAAQFFVEVGAHGDKQDALKRSGLYYLLRLEKFHER